MKQQQPDGTVLILGTTRYGFLGKPPRPFFPKNPELTTPPLSSVIEWSLALKDTHTYRYTYTASDAVDVATRLVRVNATSIPATGTPWGGFAYNGIVRNVLPTAKKFLF
jgi:hypothetical protein